MDALRHRIVAAGLILLALCIVAPSRAASPTDAEEAAATARRLKATILPRVEFREADIRDVVATLNEMTQSGVWLRWNDSPLQDGVSGDPFSEPDPFSPSIAETSWPRITLEARQISLVDVLKAVARLADARYEIEGPHVILQSRKSPRGELVRRSYRLSQRGALVIQDLYRGMRANAPREFPEIEGSVLESTNSLKKVLERLCVGFPHGASVEWSQGSLTALNDSPNLARLESLLVAIDPPPRLFELQLRTMGVPFPELDSLDAELPISPATLTRLASEGKAAERGRAQLTLGDGEHAEFGITVPAVTQPAAHAVTSTSLTCTASLAESGDSMDLTLSYESRICWHPASTGQDVSLSVLPGHTCDVRNVICHMKWTNHVMLANGATVIAAGGASSANHTEALYFLLTARLLDPGGRPVAEEVPPSSTASTEQEVTSGLIERMKQIIIPEMEFRDDDIDSVYAYLASAARMFAPSEWPALERDKGVTIVVLPPLCVPVAEVPTGAADSQDSSASVAGETTAPTPGASMRRDPCAITLTARYISLWDALKTITTVVDHRFCLDGDTVYIMARDRALDEEWEFQLYPYHGPPPFRCMVSAFPAERLAAPPTEDLTRIFGEFGVPVLKGTGVFASPSIHRIAVVNSPQNHAKFRSILSELDVAPLQVEVQTRYLECRVRDFDTFLREGASPRAALSRMREGGKCRLLAAPSIIAEPFETSSFCSSVVTTQAGGKRTMEDFDLELTPELSPDGHLITLTLTAAITASTDTGSQHGGPPGYTSTLTTRLMLSDGAEILAGGGTPAGDGETLRFLLVSARLVGTDGIPIRRTAAAVHDASPDPFSPVQEEP